MSTSSSLISPYFASQVLSDQEYGDYYAIYVKVFPMRIMWNHVKIRQILLKIASNSVKNCVKFCLKMCQILLKLSKILKK